jgi:tetratricopeptide (TPR) repeat protein
LSPKLEVASLELADRLQSALGDRYRIEGEIGSGGMATVFRAQDLKHDRAVALKVLRDEVAQSVGAERFLQEIRIVAKLQHPHVLTLLDSGEIEDTLYYVMPFIQGESLRQKLARENELPVPEALRLLREVADALAFAHQNGVVHRDIKPDNVLLAGRHAVVADFGVSKALSAATGKDKVTTLGVALGTPAYMAPEQAAADQNIDHRADIYALGILGYELLTGQPPFTGTTPQQILGAQVTATPKTVTEMRPAVPEAVSAVLMRCLEKRPADRWQTADEVRAQFEALQTSSGGMTPTGMTPVAPAGRPGWLMPAVAAVVVVAAAVGGWLAFGPVGGSGGSEEGTGMAAAAAREDESAGRVVVLQLENMTGDPSLDPLGRLGASWMERALTQAAVAQVVPLQSLAGAEGEAARTAAPATVAREMRAELVVTGEYYRRGQEIEVVAHVLRPGADQVLFDLEGVRGDPADPMKAFGALSQQVAGAVASFYGANWFASPELYSPPPSLEVYRLHAEMTEDFSLYRYQEAVAISSRISEMDSTWLGHLVMAASAYANLGRLPQADSLHRFLYDRTDRLTRMEQVLVDWAHSWNHGDPAGEYRAARELISLDPVGSAYAAGTTCSRTNRLEEALGHLEGRDTTSVIGQNWVSWDVVESSVLARLGRYEEALEVIGRGRRFRPESTRLLGAEFELVAAMGRRAEVEALLEEARAFPMTQSWSPAEPLRQAALVAAGVGRPDDAAYYADLALQEAARAPGDTRYLRGRALAYAGRWEEAEPLLREVLAEAPEDLARLGNLGWVLASAGKREEAAAIRDQLASMELEFFYRGTALYWRAAISTALGESDQAIQELQGAVTSGQPFNTWTIWFPWFTPLHDDPRYQRLVEPR